MSDKGKKLIGSLLSDPAEFTDKGLAYSLLQEFFDGHPLDTLRPLLRHADTLVRRAAVWVASEIGEKAHSLLEDVLPLLRSGDRYLAYHALEFVAVCAIGQRASYLREVVFGLESDDEVLRVLAMRLIGNTDDGSLRVVLEEMDNNASGQLHRDGLTLLIGIRREDRKRVVSELLGREERLLRRYGAILARRALPEQPELIKEVAKSGDGDVRRYASEAIDVHQVD